VRGRYKAWAAPFLAGHPENVIENWDPTDPFFAVSPLYLEIGAGKGDFVLQLSLKKKGHYLALERDVSVAGILAKRVVDEQREDIRVIPGDFDAWYESLKNLRFQTIYLNFSDPWPKKRHWKRRLTTSGRLVLMKSLLAEGGEIRIKTDNDSLYEFTKEQAVIATLELVKDDPDYAFDESDDAMSEYERNFRSLNKSIHRLIYRVAKKE
jgi:tRNA (guanine-N7-)-methyltransferase